MSQAEQEDDALEGAAATSRRELAISRELPQLAVPWHADWETGCTVGAAGWGGQGPARKHMPSRGLDCIRKAMEKLLMDSSSQTFAPHLAGLLWPHRILSPSNRKQSLQAI